MGETQPTNPDIARKFSDVHSVVERPAYWGVNADGKIVRQLSPDDITEAYHNPDLGSAPDATVPSPEPSAGVEAAAQATDSQTGGSVATDNPWADLRAAQERVNEAEKQIKIDHSRWNRRMRIHTSRADVEEKITKDANYSPTKGELQALEDGDLQERQDKRRGLSGVSEDDIRYYRTLRDQAETGKDEDAEPKPDVDPFDAEIERMTPEELRSSSYNLAREAGGRLHRFRQNVFAIDRVFNKVNLDNEDRSAIGRYLGKPIGQDEQRPAPRKDGDAELLKPERFDALTDDEAMQLLEREADRARFNRRDAVVASERAEKIIRKMAKDNNWSDDQLQGRLESLGRLINSGEADNDEGQIPAGAQAPARHMRPGTGEPSDDDNHRPQHAQRPRNGGQRPGDIGGVRRREPGAVRDGDDTAEYEPQHMGRRNGNGLRDRVDDARVRATAYGNGDFRPHGRVDRDREGMSRGKKIAVGLGALAAATVGALLWSKRIDINPWDNDISSTIDINPFNSDNNEVPQYALGDQEAYHAYRDAGVDDHGLVHHMIDNPRATARVFRNPEALERQVEWAKEFAAKYRKDNPEASDMVVDLATRTALDQTYETMEYAARQK